ncbi:MAG TPA: PDZ domain-containing protein [Chloroflexota bacterium]|jgi:PDZ domain-containing protein
MQWRRGLIGCSALLLCLAVVTVSVVLTALLPGLASRYYLLLPGEAFPVAPRIRVPDDMRKETGQLSFTVVYERAASLPDALVESTRRGVRVVPYEQIIPPGQTEEQSTRQARRLMNESQVAAAVVAERAAGYEVKVGGEGVRIVTTLPGTPASEALRPGDVVLGIDGQPTGTATDLIEAIRRHQPGETLELRVRRDGKETTIRVGTVPSTSEPSRPMVGATVETEGFDARLPVQVSIESGTVVGPSAGLMFALGIYDALTPGVLAAGVPIAGTGTIGLDGRVGPVDGARQKVIGAERGGYRVFLAPADNAVEARAAASSIRVVSVDTFAEALDALRRVDG